MKRKLLIYAIQIVVDMLNDYLYKLRTGQPMTPFRVEKNDERDNVINPDVVNDFEKFFKI